MNYHNFASRLMIQRLPAGASTKEPAKAAPKKARRATRRRFAPAAALVLTCFLALRVNAGAETDGLRVSPPPAWRVNFPTLLITLTGLGVVFLRIPVFWRRDLHC